MKKRVQKSLGIDISERHISLAFVERRGNTYRLLKSCHVPIPTEVFDSEGKVNPERLGRLLCDLRRQHKMRIGYATITLLGEPGIQQILDVPKRLPENLSAFVHGELKQYVAMARDEMTTDYGPLMASAQGHPRLLALAANAQPLERLVHQCQKARLYIQAMEPSLFGYIRTLYHHRMVNQFDRNVALIILRDRTLQIGVFRNGNLDFVRCKSLVVPTSEEEAICKQIAKELSATMQYYGIEVLQAPEKWQISVVTEQGDSLRPQSLRVLQLLHPLADIEILTPLAVNELLCETVSDLPREQIVSPVAVGLALRTLETHDWVPEINLLPQRIVQVRKLVHQALTTVATAAVLALFMAVAVQGLSWHAQRLRGTLTAEGRLLNPQETEALFTQHHGTAQRLDRMTQNFTQIRDLLKGYRQVNWSGLLADISDMTGENLSIKRVESPRDEPSLIIEGVSSTDRSIQLFAQQLKVSSHILEAQLLRAEQQNSDQERIITYRIKCDLVSKVGL